MAKKASVFVSALTASIPVMLGYIPIGIAYGFILTQSGIPWYFAGASSLFIYAGATQFMALGLWGNLAPIPEIAFATLLMNMRHAFFGLSLIKKFSGTGKAKTYLIFALTDETYALLSCQEEQDKEIKKRFYLFLSGLNQFYWLFGSVAGAFLWNSIKADLRGLDFALTALFAVLTIEQYRKTRKLKPFIIAIISAGFAFLLPWREIFLLFAISLGTLLLMVSRRKEKNE